MDKHFTETIVNTATEALSRFKFNERHDFRDRDIVAVIKKPSNLLRILFRGLGICAIVVVPESITDAIGLKAFVEYVRRDVNSRFGRKAAFRNTYLFVVMVCRHDLFVECQRSVGDLVDKSGFHAILIQGVLLIDCATRAVTWKFIWIPQHKREFNVLVSAISGAVK